MVTPDTLNGDMLLPTSAPPPNLKLIKWIPRFAPSGPPHDHSVAGGVNADRFEVDLPANEVPSIRRRRRRFRTL